MQRFFGYVEKGNGTVVALGITSSSVVMQSYPSAVVSVFDSGTMNLSTIFSDNASTPKANPFTSGSDGFYFFYAANGRYDVQFSSGGIASPYSYGDVVLGDGTQLVSLPSTVVFSATPTFDASSHSTFIMALTGNVTSSTITGMVAGQIVSFILTQDGTGGRTFVFPATVLRPPVIASKANQSTVVTLQYDGANWHQYAATGDTTVVRNLSNIRYADQYVTGADWCARVTLADTDLGANPGEIWVNQNAVPGACATPPTISAQHTLRFIEGGNYVLSDTLSLPVGTKVIAGVGGQPMQQWTYGTGAVGAILKYTGGVASTPVVRAAGNDVTLYGFAVDCQATTGTVGVIYNSTTVGYSGLNINRVTTYSCHQGLVVGDPSTTITDCVATPNTIGCHQADSISLDAFTCYGKSGNLTDECVHINAANGAQQSTFDHVTSQGMNIGFNAVRSNGGFVIRNHGAGSPQGASPTQILMGAKMSAPYTIENSHCEGSWTYFIHDSIDNSGTTPTSVWIASTDSCGSLIDGYSNITSISNGGSTGIMVAGGNSFVQSINDKRVWTTSGNGRLDYRYIGNDAVSGTIGIGTPPVGQSGIFSASSILTTTNQKSFQAASTFNSAATGSGIDFLSSSSTAAAAFTMTAFYHFYATNGTVGAGSAITSEYGFFCNNLSMGGSPFCFFNNTSAPNNFGTGNSVFGVATFVFPTGTARTITLNNAGANSTWRTEISGTATVDLASVNSGACSTDSSDVTVTGAAVGDSVIVTAGTALQAGGFLIGRVTAAGTARFQFCNLSGGAIDRASDTYTIRVLR